MAILTFGGKVVEAGKAIYDVMNPGRIKEFRGELDSLKDRIKELEENPGRLAIDTRDLDEAHRKLKELEASKAAFDAAQKQQTVEQAESGKNIKTALTAAGMPKVTAELKSQIQKQFEADSDVLKETSRAVADAREGYAKERTYRDADMDW